MRSGNIYLGLFGFLRSLGDYGLGWSSMSSSYLDQPTSAGAFDFVASALLPSNEAYNRWHGLPVRCLASGV